MEEDNRASEFMIKNLKLAGGLRGWDRGTKRLWPTLTRQTLDEAWGFSLISGCDIGEGTAHWSGIVAHRNDKGRWLKINSVKSHGPADLAGIQKNDFVTRINGQIVFHLSLKDVERIIRNSGCSLLLDIERDGPRSMMFDGGVHGQALNFLFEDYKPTVSLMSHQYKPIYARLK
ncbi:uncharacterized protein LOC131887378 [Tigriopus californicus]|uniref:uncharacterized protein LOC131887378 n=1 Tax=Tigriopus californicus TaxID=6832 RepID=UPI0027DAB174|nr:uncharacterized protein LOC131887378 [Tigriopus californicus]